jgi:hypothetical protein
MYVKRFFISGLVGLAFFGQAHAQTLDRALVVSACGSPPITYTAGQELLPTVDTNGKLCLSSGGGGGSGTVTTFSVVTANGVSATVANPTTTPAATFTLGAITPSSVAIGAGSAITSSGAGGALGSNAFTSTAYLPLAGGTMVGTITAADASTYGSGGLSSVTFAGINQAAPSTYVLGVTGTTQTVASNNGAVQISQTINTTSNTTDIFAIKATMTAGLANFVNFYGGISGSASEFQVDKGGNVFMAGAVRIPVSGNAGTYIISGQVALANSGFLAFSSSASAAGSTDTFISRGAAANVQLGGNPTASPIAQALSTQGSRPGTDTNVGGGNLTIASGDGTGTGTNGVANGATPYMSSPALALGSSVTIGSSVLGINGATFFAGTASSNAGIFINSSGTMTYYNNGVFRWSASADPSSTADTGFSRDSAGVIDIGTGAQGSKAGSLNLTNLTAIGDIMVGSATALTLNAGEIGMAKIAASGSAPGAAGLKFEAVCGTGAGTLKIIAYAGTSATPVTIVDNVGASATGC